MNRNDAFSRCHPLVNFLYFALVLLGAMLLQHPVWSGDFAHWRDRLLLHTRR